MIDDPMLATEWAEDPIELEVKLRKAEQSGWKRLGIPFNQKYVGTSIPIGWFIQKLVKYDKTPTPFNHP